MFDGPAEVSVALGDAARVLLRKLRTDDSLYRLSPAAFAMVLPNTSATDMNLVASRVSEGLTDASGASNRFTFDLEVVNYPEQVSSAYEMERLADAFSLRRGAAAATAEVG
jgi:GGDEF domain-containing protein